MMGKMMKLFKIFKRKKKTDNNDKDRKDDHEDKGDEGDALRNSQLREAAFNGKLYVSVLTPLARSSEEGNGADLTVLQQLLDAKANINSSNRSGQTALHFAAARCACAHAWRDIDILR
eukprot:631227-Hanusia_phi.AAC.2